MPKFSFNFVRILTRSKLLVLLILLWSAPAFGGSPEATPSPECKSAVGLVKPASADVKEAFKVLGQALEKTRRAMEEEGRVLEGYQKTLISSGKPPSDEPLNRARAAMNNAYDRELSAGDNLKQAIQRYDQRIADAKARCGGLQ